eukprot:8595287-Lingulodinium_polyedra.AAC.1
MLKPPIVAVGPDTSTKSPVEIVPVFCQDDGRFHRATSHFATSHPWAAQCAGSWRVRHGFNQLGPNHTLELVGAESCVADVGGG